MQSEYVFAGSVIEDPSSRTILFSAFLICASLCLAIPNQSLWIDEGMAVWLPSQSSVRGLFSTLNRLNTSDPQMPFYLFYMWVWTRLFGTGETALRASNIPFALLLSFAFSWGFPRLLRRRLALLLRRLHDADPLGCTHWAGGTNAATFITQPWMKRKKRAHLPQSALPES